ncbi:Uncharacterised protein [uncultured archaeon]|nr:Uncharacterised protein [uncultured archaeon]
MTTAPSKNPASVWQTTGQDVLQIQAEGGAVVGWIDANAQLQGGLAAGIIPTGGPGTTFNFLPGTQNGVYKFVRADGTAAGCLYFQNASAPSNTYTVGYENTDGEFHWDTYSLGVLSSSLTLDVDGHVSIYGSAGGGITTDYTTGETCIPPSTVNGRPLAISTRFSPNTGLVTRYGGQTFAVGGLQGTIVAGGSTITGNVGPITILNTNASGYAGAGRYRFEGSVKATQANAGGTVTVTAGYTSPVGATTQTSATFSVATTATASTFDFLLNVVASSAITITIATANSPTYSVTYALTVI